MKEVMWVVVNPAAAVVGCATRGPEYALDDAEARLPSGIRSALRHRIREARTDDRGAFVYEGYFVTRARKNVAHGAPVAWAFLSGQIVEEITRSAKTARAWSETFGSACVCAVVLQPTSAPEMDSAAGVGAGGKADSEALVAASTRT